MFVLKATSWRSWLFAGVLVVLVASCAAPPAAPGGAEGGAAATTGGGRDYLVLPINVNIPAPDIWNPYIPGTFILQGMNQNLMEPLFMLNYETGEIEGWLAESYSANETQDEFTVVLREGTEWSDGTPLTSEDVVFTINMLKDHAPELNWSGAVERWVESVEAVDDRTIKFTLTDPNPRFVLENLAGTTSQAIVPLPKHVWEGQDPVTFRNPFNAETGAPIFSGPYTVASFSSTEFNYKRNDNWWGAKSGAFKLPAPTEIRRPWVGNAETHNQMLVANEVDAGPGSGATLSVIRSLQARNPKLRAYNDEPPYGWLDPCPRMFTVNHTVPPWDKKEMRWALSYTFDRQQIVDVIYEGASVPATFIFPTYEGMMPYYEAINDLVAPIAEHNPEKARELIESQGYTFDESTGFFVGPDGQNLKIDVVAPPFMEPTARLVVQQLTDGGIDAVLRILEWGIFRDQTGRGQFEGTTDWSGCGSVIEPWFGMNRYHKSWVNPVGEPGTEYVDNTNNAGRWVNDEYSALVDQMGVLPLGDPQVIELMREAVAIWVDELPAIPLIQTPAFYLFNETYWTNWPTADNNYIQPPLHWQHFLRTLTELKPAQ
ncbi:MAG TPA: ABC transporter substrate-binding protein [Caldilineaceae bacterium]|nr:ABC transporter substrate-binding protein [Caldilineaceae bacterium]